MNTITERERTLAATLKSLSLEAPPRDSKPTRLKPWRSVLLAGVTVMVVATMAAFILQRPEVARTVEAEAAAASAQSNSTDDTPGLAADQQAAVQVPAASPEVTGSGTVVAQQVTTVYARQAGQIADVFVEPGDEVRVGQRLVVLDNTDVQFALEQASADKVTAQLLLDARHIDLQQASNTLERTQQLIASDAASRHQLDDAHTQMERASNAVAQARQALQLADIAVRRAEETREQLIVRAPVAGTITRLDAPVGDSVLAHVDSARESHSLLTITDLTSLVIDADIAETHITTLSSGIRGEAVLDSFPDQAFAVELIRLAPVVSAEKGTITLRLSLIAPPAGIKPHMAARIRISATHTGQSRS